MEGEGCNVCGAPTGPNTIKQSWRQLFPKMENKQHNIYKKTTTFYLCYMVCNRDTYALNTAILRRNSFVQFHTMNDSFRQPCFPCFKVPYRDKFVNARRYCIKYCKLKLCLWIAIGKKVGKKVVKLMKRKSPLTYQESQSPSLRSAKQISESFSTNGH